MKVNEAERDGAHDLSEGIELMAKSVSEQQKAIDQKILDTAKAEITRLTSAIRYALDSGGACACPRVAGGPCGRCRLEEVISEYPRWKQKWPK